MKFLVVLTLLATTTAFAQGREREQTYKCWDTAQGTRGYPTYVFETEQNGHLELELKFPRRIRHFERRHDCWIGEERNPTSTTTPTTPADPREEEKFKVCLGEGQHINGLIPVEIEEEFFEGTVYCERGFKRVFEDRGGHDGGGNSGIGGGM